MMQVLVRHQLRCCQRTCNVLKIETGQTMLTLALSALLRGGIGSLKQWQEDRAKIVGTILDENTGEHKPEPHL